MILRLLLSKLHTESAAIGAAASLFNCSLLRSPHDLSLYHTPLLVITLERGEDVQERKYKIKQEERAS